MHQACLSLLENVRLIIWLIEKLNCLVSDLADAARGSYGSYGSSSRMLFEAASPLSRYVVNLLICHRSHVVPGHQQYICGGLVGSKMFVFYTHSPPLCLANNLGLGLALSW